MIIVLKKRATRKQVDHIVQSVRAWGWVSALIWR